MGRCEVGKVLTEFGLTEAGTEGEWSDLGCFDSERRDSDWGLGWVSERDVLETILKIRYGFIM
jgi:hypothetical protein